jgi:hypothetical protein
MKGAFWLLLAFGLGMLVGRPSQIILKAPDPQAALECPVCPKNPAQAAILGTSFLSIAKSPEGVVDPAPSPTPSPSATPKEGEDHADNGPPEEDVDEQNKELTEQEVNKWVRELVNDLSRYLAGYEIEEHKIMVLRRDLPNLPKLRAALDKANIAVFEEGPVNVGNYVYYLKVRLK